ncbi:MAG: flagellar basal body P-ring formation chaperone FlgA, partial [Planctomycetota bacterium]|nr:flagellar basal body P-ring formation chaperone FlgA [Planctomycetota bacterium]
SKVVKRQINQGKVLCQSMLDDPTIFERGDVVKIRIRRGNVELVDTGMALETGKLNQSARVQSSSTEAVLKGLVSEDGIVY